MLLMELHLDSNDGGLPRKLWRSQHTHLSLTGTLTFSHTLYALNYQTYKVDLNPHLTCCAEYAMAPVAPRERCPDSKN